MDLECPYCKEELEVSHYDGWGYEEGVKHQMKCEHCDKQFVFKTSILFYYEPEKADCLNGNGHNYKKTITYPEEFSEMQCTICDKKRVMTEAERLEYKIGTKESYFETLK